MLRILAAEPYYGGSHRAFLDGWRQVSRHRWTVVGLPAHKWKWRMRHAPVTLAEELCRTAATGGEFDLMFCSDMLNLAEFKGLAPRNVRELPSVAYFHENQLTYPVRFPDQRDLHFGFTNFTTALAADRVWFNSAFHRDSFLRALADLLRGMPDYNEGRQLDPLQAKSEIRPPGIERMPDRIDRKPGPARLLWVARWEFDKNPELFFDALCRLHENGTAFRASVLGEIFAEVPPVFAEARARLREHIDHWGFLESRDDYVAALMDADIVVSTADHEFFGVSVLEAAAAGCWPVLPNRLAYPELFGSEKLTDSAEFFYDGTREGLAARLTDLTGRVQHDELWGNDSNRIRRITEPYWWEHLAPRLDDALEEIARGGPRR